jgi:hypothetical protein
MESRLLRPGYVAVALAALVVIMPNGFPALIVVLPLAGFVYEANKGSRFSAWSAALILFLLTPLLAWVITEAPHPGLKFLLGIYIIAFLTEAVRLIRGSPEEDGRLEG